MGLFVVFEGVEGCGKSTQVELLGHFLEKRGIPYIATREPGGTAIGEKIREILLHSDHIEICPLTELLLYTASRVQHIHQIIKPALGRNKVVICDRFFDATIAYQGYGEGIPLQLIYKINRDFLHNISPDVTILLDCTVEVGLGRSRKRIKAQGREKEEGRFEDKDLYFHRKVREAYLKLAKEESARFFVVNAEHPVKSVHTEICHFLMKKLKETGYVI